MRAANSVAATAVSSAGGLIPFAAVKPTNKPRVFSRGQFRGIAIHCERDRSTSAVTEFIFITDDVSHVIHRLALTHSGTGAGGDVTAAVTPVAGEFLPIAGAGDRFNPHADDGSGYVDGSAAHARFVSPVGVVIASPQYELNDTFLPPPNDASGLQWRPEPHSTRDLQLVVIESDHHTVRCVRNGVVRTCGDPPLYAAREFLPPPHGGGGHSAVCCGWAKRERDDSLGRGSVFVLRDFPSNSRQVYELTTAHKPAAPAASAVKDCVAPVPTDFRAVDTSRVQSVSFLNASAMLFHEALTPLSRSRSTDTRNGDLIVSDSNAYCVRVIELTTSAAAASTAGTTFAAPDRTPYTLAGQPNQPKIDTDSFLAADCDGTDVPLWGVTAFAIDSQTRIYMLDVSGDFRCTRVLRTTPLHGVAPARVAALAVTLTRESFDAPFPMDLLALIDRYCGVLISVIGTLPLAASGGIAIGVGRIYIASDTDIYRSSEQRDILPLDF